MSYLRPGFVIAHIANPILRAAHEATFRLHGTSTPFRAIELTGSERERVVEAYRRKLGHAVDRYFKTIPDPSAHPVFRMDEVSSHA